MDINSDEEPSSLFKLFTPQTESTVNGNINKETEVFQNNLIFFLFQIFVTKQS